METDSLGGRELDNETNNFGRSSLEGATVNWMMKNVYKMLTFCFNIKSSLLKLLCTLARLCEETPLQPLRLNFLPHPHSTLRIAFFRRHDNRTRVKACRAYISALRSPTCSPHDITPPRTSHLSPAKLISKSASRHFASPPTAGKMFPLRRAKYFLCAHTLFFPLQLPRTASIHQQPPLPHRQMIQSSQKVVVLQGGGGDPRGRKSRNYYRIVPWGA